MHGHLHLLDGILQRVGGTSIHAFSCAPIYILYQVISLYDGGHGGAARPTQAARPAVLPTAGKTSYEWGGYTLRARSSSATRSYNSCCAHGRIKAVVMVLPMVVPLVVCASNPFEASGHGEGCAHLKRWHPKTCCSKWWATNVNLTFRVSQNSTSRVRLLVDHVPCRCLEPARLLSRSACTSTCVSTCT